MPRASLLALSGLLAGLTGCNEYDLNRGEATNPDVTGTSTTTPEPSDEPDIAVSPTSLDFGGLPKDCPADPLTVTITNEGLADLEVTDIALEGEGSSVFTVDWDGAAFTLATGEEKAVEVGFTPNAWVDYEIDIEITSNDPDEGALDVPTAGTGAENTSYEQTFTQEYFDEVDVLWVVDNSCSMGEELQQVRDNFASFVGEFVNLGLDYHLAVVTTDMDNPTHSGRIQGSVVTPASSDPETEFLTYIDQGSSGSGSERGFDATQAALTEPLLSGANAGFFRDDAALAVIVVSDENDQSGVSSSSFASWMLGLKSDSSMVSFSAICGDRGLGCLEWVGTDTLQANGGDAYIDVTEDTDGFFASICTSDYDEALQHLSLTAAGMTVSFLLDREPANLSEIVVEVEGAAIAYDVYDGWSYQTDTNAIIFHGDAIPGPGDTVYVSYPIASECPS